MGNPNIHQIARALRDVATKAREMETVVEPSLAGGSLYDQPHPYQREKYSREQIVGRIEGLADALVSLTDDEDF